MLHVSHVRAENSSEVRHRCSAAAASSPLLKKSLVFCILSLLYLCSLLIFFLFEPFFSFSFLSALCLCSHTSFFLFFPPLFFLPPSSCLPLSLLVLHLTERQTETDAFVGDRICVCVYVCVHALPPQFDSSATCAQRQLPTDGGGVREGEPERQGERGR